MQRFVIVLLVVLLSACSQENSMEGKPFPVPPKGSSFRGDYEKSASKCETLMHGGHIEGIICRDKPLPGEVIVREIQLMDGEHKGAYVCLTCYKQKPGGGEELDAQGKPILSGQVPCMEKSETENDGVKLFNKK